MKKNLPKLLTISEAGSDKNEIRQMVLDWIPVIDNKETIEFLLDKFELSEDEIKYGKVDSSWGETC